MSKASSMKNGVLGLIMKYVIIDYNEFTREFADRIKNTVSIIDITYEQIDQIIDKIYPSDIELRN